MTGNKSSRLSFTYQNAVGTESIDDATDTTYYFRFTIHEFINKKKN